MARYIKCSHCGKPIYFGQRAVCHDSYAGIFCSYNCLCNYFEIFRTRILNEDIVEEQSPINKTIKIYESKT